MITKLGAKTDMQGDLIQGLIKKSLPYTSPKPKLRKRSVVRFIWKETLNRFNVSCSSWLPVTMVEHKFVTPSDGKDMVRPKYMVSVWTSISTHLAKPSM